MSLGQLLLAVTLILVGIVWLGWATISIKFLGGMSVLTGVVLLLESAGVFNVAVPRVRRAE